MRTRLRRAFLLALGVTPVVLLTADFGSRSRPDAKRGIRVVTVNVDTRPLEVAAALRPLEPDIVLMQETGASCASAAAAFEFEFEDGSDQCIVSRWRLSASSVAWPGPWQPPQFSTAMTPAGPLALVNARLAIPEVVAALATLGNQWYTERQRKAQYGALRKVVGDVRPTVVCGDFNALPFEPSLGPTLRDTWTGSGYGATFPARLPAARIDQCWATSEVRILKTWTWSVPSDHRAVLVELELGQPPSNQGQLAGPTQGAETGR